MAYTKTNWVNGTTPLNDKNMNKIENALENLDTNISKSTDEYSSTRTYSIGELVIYNNKLYKANQDITTAEAFNSSHWTEVTLLSDVNEIKAVVNNNADNLNKMDEEIDNLDDILTWKKQSYTVNAEYITYVGYSDCYKMNGLVVFSFNFNVKEINGKDITLITGLPNCRSTRYVFGFAGNNTIAEGYITSNGELKNDGNWASGWYSGIVVYPGN